MIAKPLFLALFLSVMGAACSVSTLNNPILANKTPKAVILPAPSTSEVLNEKAEASEIVLSNGVLKSAPKADNDPRPFNDDRLAQADVEATLFAAKASKKNALIIMGANWCHDSRALARHFETPKFQTLFNTEYETLYVDIGQKDRNIDIAKRFGLSEIVGTPTVFIISPEGEVLNLDSAVTWRNSASMEGDDIFRYFSDFAKEARKVR